MKKILITVIGTTGAGKTTLCETLINAEGIKKIYPILQLSCRKPRHDDYSSQLLKIVDKKEYKKTKFFSCHGDYGIPKYEMDKFIYGKCMLGISIVSTLDVIYLKKIFTLDPYRDKVDIFNILITLEDTVTKELLAVEQVINNFFKKKEKLKKLYIQQKLINNFFYCKKYHDLYIDLHLHKSNENILDYCKSIEEKLINKYQLNLIYKEKYLKKYIQNISKRIINSRTLTGSD